MMKVLLVAVNAKYIHSNLAIYSLQAYARKYAENIVKIELTINHSEEDILKQIYNEKADVVAFSCYIWNIGVITRVASELKKVLPDTRIWLGGPEVSYDAKACLQDNRAIDGIMIGEGEQSFLELLEYYVEGTKELKNIEGIAYKDKQEKVIITPVRQPLSLDVIPFPYEDLEDFKNRIIYYESSRGCPFSCSYCLSSIDKRVRLRSTELVKKELEYLIDHKVPQIKFVDRTFNCNKKHAMDIWSFIKEKDNGITNFHFEISADLLGESEIEFLSTLRPGQIQFEIGVQSTNPDTIEAIHRNMDFLKLSSNVRKIKQGNNIHLHLDLIAGLPMEDYYSFERSFQEVYQLKPDQLQLGFLKILKGSSMETDSRTYGITYRSTPPYEVLFTKWLTYEEVLKIKGICEMVEIYYNSSQFTYAISFLEHFYSSPMQLYQALSDYYKTKNMFMVAHSRIKRYEILLDFFKEIVIESEETKDKSEWITLMEEILVLDLFLREAMKTRPEFAPERPSQRRLREIYDLVEIDHRLLHIEEFTFDVMASAGSGHRVKKKTIMLFDYHKRDPLNNSAKLTVLD